MAPSPRTSRTARDGRVLPLFLIGFAGIPLFSASIAVSEVDPPTAAPALAFSRHSEPTARRTLSELRASVESSEVRVHEPYEAGVVRFSALPFDQVLDAVYSDSWRSEEEIVFTCVDGYQPTVPVQRVLSHRAYLAFARADQLGFTIRKRESGVEKEVELGPFYLVWENLNDEQIRQEADYGWPYQMVGVDLVRRIDFFPALTPPASAPADVQAGFDAFRIHCSKCHKLNGEGGTIGPALTAETNPLLYRDDEWLRSWIEEPSRIRPNSRMPALNPALPHRRRVVDQILAYLRVMLSGDRPTAPEGAEGR